MDEDEQVEILGSQNIATGGPFKLEMKVMLVGEGGQYDGYDAWATIDLPPGELPAREAIERRLGNALTSTDGFRLATRKEFVSSLLSERTGVPGLSLSVPGPVDFEFAPQFAPEATP